MFTFIQKYIERKKAQKQQYEAEVQARKDRYIAQNPQPISDDTFNRLGEQEKELRECFTRIDTNLNKLLRTTDVPNDKK